MHARELARRVESPRLAGFTTAARTVASLRGTSTARTVPISFVHRLGRFEGVDPPSSCGRTPPGDSLDTPRAVARRLE